MILRSILNFFIYIWVALQCVWLFLRGNHYAQLVNEHVQKKLDKYKSTFAFLKALVKNPGKTGAILPSSKWLARTMAAYISAPDNTLIVELGAGTGVITEAILAKGIAPERLISVEHNPQLAAALRTRFPKIHVIEGDASQLTQLLEAYKKPVGAIISGLPLRSLPTKVRVAILAEIPRVLGEAGRYIQFTYDITNYKNIYPTQYHLLQSSIVWRNIPPAKVTVHTFHGI